MFREYLCEMIGEILSVLKKKTYTHIPCTNNAMTLLFRHIPVKALQIPREVHGNVQCIIKWFVLIIDNGNDYFHGYNESALKCNL